jgi:hypothetical protein
MPEGVMQMHIQNAIRSIDGDCGVILLEKAHGYCVKALFTQDFCV